jgi:uncharacterized protein
MSDRVPDVFDPRRFAEQGRVVQGDVALASMGRLGQRLSNLDGVASVELTFGVDALGVKHVTGRITARLALTCQRCLGPLDLSVEARVSLGLVESEAQAERLPDIYEPLMVEAGRVAMRDIVEDELILALPIVPRHSPGSCTALGQAETAEGGAPRIPDSPFAVLARLKRSRP